MNRTLPLLLLLATAPAPGCFYRIGSGVMAGVLDEAGGKGRSGGVDPVVDGLVQRALLAELGHQLGQGLQAGVTEFTPEQEAELAATIDGLISVAALRAGQGLRRDVAPELRSMVQRDIVEAFAEGVRGELGASLEETVDRLVTRAVVSLRRNLEDEDLQYVSAGVIRDAIYLAMREGGASPAVGDTLQTTLEQNVLDPFSNNVANLATQIAAQVNAQAERTENTLKGVIGGLSIILFVLGILYYTSNRHQRRTELDLRNMDAALAQLDEPTRQLVKQRLRDGADAAQPAAKEPR